MPPNTNVILLTPRADKQLHHLPPSIHAYLITAINKLATDPYPPKSRKLTNRPGYRLRRGDYRIIYTVNAKNHQVTIIAVAHRKEIYRVK